VASNLSTLSRCINILLL